MKKDRLDGIIECVVKGNFDEIQDLKESDFPDIDALIDRAENEIFNDKIVKLQTISKKKNKRKTFFKVVALAMSILFISLVFSFIHEIEGVKAFRNNMLRTIVTIGENIRYTFSNTENIDGPPVLFDEEFKFEYSTMEEAFDQIKISVIYPRYLPEGYEIDRIEWNQILDGTNIVRQVYKNDSDGYIIVNQISITDDINLTSVIFPKESDLKKVEVMGAEGYMTKGSNIINTIWIKDGYRYEITATLEEDTFIIILNNLAIKNPAE